MIEDKKPHRFQPGQSGNPAGRPPGSGNIAKLRAAISDVVPEIIDRLKAQALEGDVAASRLLLERVLPSVKSMEQAHVIDLSGGSSLADQGRAVLASVAAGELAPSQGSQLIGAIAALGKVVELDELATRIEALEKAHAKSQKTPAST